MNTPYCKILTGDCQQVLAKARAEYFDLVVTDPPYIVNYSDRNGRSIQNDRKADWLLPCFRQIARVLKPNRFCISFYGWNQADKFLIAWRKAGLFPVGHFVWMKSYASSARHVRSMHECAYLLAKGQPERPTVLLNDVLPWSYSGNRLHPTQKPLCALEPLIEAFSKPGDIILDPFCGSGATGRAALRLGRGFVGIELDPTYARIASESIAAS